MADALAMLRMEDIFIESFAVEDGKIVDLNDLMIQSKPCMVITWPEP